MAKIKKYNKRRHLKHKPKGVGRKSFEKVYWPYLPLILMIGVLLTFSFQSQALSFSKHHHFGKVLDYATTMSIDQLLVQTNAQRTGNGVAALALNDKLNAAARNYWSHYTPDGDAPWVFVTNQGYIYQKLGENLAAGFSDEQTTINGWMASPSHRENLLDSAYREVGFGFANIVDYTAAGGGPMTVVVAFYGQPVITAQSANVTPQQFEQSQQPVSAPPAANAEVKAESETAKTPAVNSQTLTPKTPPKPIRTANAQLVSTNLAYSGYATGGVILAMVAIVCLWASRHLLAIRRALVDGEKFAIKHPLFDVGLVVAASICYLLVQTAGIIQ
jgi:hypothetical protein